ncbi:hypothetical protein A7K93_01885 [Candidatus Methylacidiphilum fumarolicum]|uniref:Uncharacterized protein n=2 Tax=Candidatus Methylacidiphilum fumarolicum TaxID=591154 RepID=I0JVN0_METFB|nr:hypothetical protein [Candidatus Methylacidiphilum fumarolicum]CCG91299.1 hypothetical protein MFUM_1020022 [Methylacidiphilum fumariolicum SolV]TFE66402.1 hypothetical protein A7K73_01450 [Candidatus Methylacidiphilum fumarolicum]TFE75259.1 hypothetical protein A7K93_01885 [Candidatus Methylacidiphilum fumarolicum]TFE76129.1 hypothetical protein A7K72_00290 [Candidatus Methylacidiphilum fumarolicum]TFE77275.1 hypothetical protein A7D33_05565 [Candidatus Methylacidiphilum fumarolicum]
MEEPLFGMIRENEVMMTKRGYDKFCEEELERPNSRIAEKIFVNEVFFLDGRAKVRISLQQRISE